ncbi:MAG TPA: polysaccharide biosynthesis protein [Vicinamibacterales bacterium]|nr:polysaccharide biosynthesis protein [Vicinamibacterales bacterium]
MFKDKKILVTGGTGSMGKTFVRRALSGELGTPKKVIVFSRDEAKQHEMRMDYLHRAVTTDEVIFNNFKNVLEFRIGDVRDYADVCSAVRDVDIVVNAAALKQVPTCEYFPMQAIATNCLGAANIVRAIEENGYPVDSVVAISTDKACKPVNVMGMSKSLQERIFIAANVLTRKTRFICVRYGNVLASRGSVIPLFHDQIRNGGPVTITVPDMTRFLLSLDQAVDTVFTALKEAGPGETYVPNAPSATVENIAKALIGKRDVEMKVVGIRPGEKMHEIMVSEEEAHHCVKRGDYYAILPMLPELAARTKEKRSALSREFSSADNVLDLKGTEALLKQHRLMPDDVKQAELGELLR